jgi:hypothetical protein
VEGLVTLALDGFEVPGLHQFIKKGLEIHDKLVAEVGPVIDALVRKVSGPLHRILPENNGKVPCHDVLYHPSGPSGGRIDDQPSARIFLRLILVDV